MTEALTLTGFAQWLNSLFFGMDFAVLSFFHDLAKTPAGSVLAPVLNLITLTGWKGLFLILLSVAMILFRKTRRTGICTLLALTIGALFTNVIVKNAVARPRPYDFDATLRTWWNYAGAHLESDFSFPSGHMTAACGFMSAFILVHGKKWLLPGFVYVLLMGASRMFLIVHYPSDILGGLFFGACAGLLSFLIVSALYRRFGSSRFLNEAL